MRIVEVQEGVVGIRWTWLPYWVASNTRLCAEIEQGLKDRALLNAVTTSEPDLEAMSHCVYDLLVQKYGGNLDFCTFLAALRVA